MALAFHLLFCQTSACLPFCVRPGVRGGLQTRWKGSRRFPLIWLRCRRRPQDIAQKVVFVSGPLLETIVSLAMLTKTNAVIFWKYGQYTVIGIMSFLTCTRVNHHKILPFLIKLHLSKIWWGSHRTRFYSQAKKPWVASLFMLAKEK